MYKQIHFKCQSSDPVHNPDFSDYIQLTLYMFGSYCTDQQVMCPGSFWTRSYLITGVDWGLDCWTGLMDWLTGLNLFISHDLHPIKYCQFGYSKHTSSHCMLGNIHECTMHKLHYRCASWIHGVQAVSSKHPVTIANVQKSIKLLFTKHNVLPECHGECWCQLLYWLMVTRLCKFFTRSLVECSHVKTMLGQQEALE